MIPDEDMKRRPEQIPWTRLIWVGVAALTLFTLGGAGSIWILKSEGGSLVPEQRGRRAERMGSEEIGIVDQRLFEQDHRAERLRQAQQQRLSTYGWVDREKGVVHIPIEAAIDSVAQGSR